VTDTARAQGDTRVFYRDIRPYEAPTLLDRELADITASAA
jgi:hypothetical protein